MPDPLVFFESFDVVDVDGRELGPVVAHDLHGLLDLAQPPLAQDVEFVEPDVFGHDHVEHGGGKALGREKSGRVVADGFLRDQDAACVDAQVVRKTLDESTVGDHQLGELIEITEVKAAFGQLVDLLLGQAKDFAELAHGGSEFEGVVYADQGRVLEPVEDEMRDVVPIAPGEIDVEIGRIGPVQVDEALEVQVELYRIDIGDPEQVGHDAIGTAPASDIIIALAARVLEDLPVDQEIRDELLLPNDLQLFLQAVEDARSELLIPVLQALIGQFSHQAEVELCIAGIGALVLGYGVLEIKSNATGTQQAFRVLDDCQGNPRKAHAGFWRAASCRFRSLALQAIACSAGCCCLWRAAAGGY